MGVWRMDTTRLSCSSARGWCCVMALPCPAIKQCRKRNHEDGDQVPHARTISDRCRLWTSHGMHEYGMSGNVFGGDHHHPDWLTTEYDPFPLRAVLYGPLRRPSVSRVNLTVTVFRSQIFGPFIAHYENLRPWQVSHMASASTDTMARTRRWLAVHGVTCEMDFVCLRHSSQQEPVV